MTCTRRASEGQRRVRVGEGYGGHSEGSREIPMVRTPADQLGSRTPSRGRSQRRDTDRGPPFRCKRTATPMGSGSRADARLSRLPRARSPNTLTVPFKSSRTRSFWCRSRPLAPGSRGFGSICRCSLWGSSVHIGNSVHIVVFSAATVKMCP